LKHFLDRIKQAKCAVAGSGLGRAIALTFAARGVRHLICADIDLENAKETANQSRQIGQAQGLKEATALSVDIRQEADVDGLFKAAKAQAGRIDICVNTAGASSRR
jgi:NAD(P)-dependent dehydrogenase (short-subunit alcohol dehydrogenase family)